MKTIAEYQPLAVLFKAMAHPIRLQILEILAQEEACVCHLMAILAQRQPYISQQLMVLRDAGLVLDRKEGLTVYYRLADGEITGLMALARQVLRAKGMEVASLTVPPSPVRGTSSRRAISPASARISPSCSSRVIFTGDLIGFRPRSR